MAVFLHANHRKEIVWHSSSLPATRNASPSCLLVPPVLRHIETELTGNDDISEESARLYQTLQQSVDDQIRQQGFVPIEGGGHNGTNGHFRNGVNGHHDNGNWLCSDKQKDLILKLIETHNLDKAEIESLARERFDKGVKH